MLELRVSETARVCRHFSFTYPWRCLAQGRRFEPSPIGGALVPAVERPEVEPRVLDQPNLKRQSVRYCSSLTHTVPYCSIA